MAGVVRCELLAGMNTQVLAHLELHTIDLGQKPGCGGVKIDRVGFGPAQVGDLVLKVNNALQRDL